jgi:predicted glycogen debranching enzyme
VAGPNPSGARATAYSGVAADEWPGGYASGSIAGILTRRYHGLLIAALPAPFGRVVMLSRVGERVGMGHGAMEPLSYEPQIARDPSSPAILWLTEFCLENGLPIWRYAAAEIILERRVLMPHMQNTVYVTYHLVSGADPVLLELRPLMHFRPHSLPVSEPLQGSYELTMNETRYEVTA